MGFIQYGHFSKCWPPAPRAGVPLGEIDAGAQNRSKWAQNTIKHFPGVYYMIICHFGPSWGHLGTHWGPQMAQNSTKMV